jgi:hypothetical protein
MVVLLAELGSIDAARIKFIWLDTAALAARKLSLLTMVFESV